MVKDSPHRKLWQITFFGMVLDMSEYVGMQRRVAGKLENLLCVMTQRHFLRIYFSTF